jgi:hypothetical protein
LAIFGRFGQKYPRRTSQYACGIFALQHPESHPNLSVLLFWFDKKIAEVEAVLPGKG